MTTQFRMSTEKSVTSQKPTITTTRTRAVHAMFRKIIKASFVVLLSTLCLSSKVSFAQLSGDYVTTYSRWSTSTELWNIDARFSAARRPGSSGMPYFYARQGSFSGGDSFYMGLQTDGAGPNQRIAIFSIWNSTEAVTANDRAECIPFSGEGVGRSCRVPYNWLPDRTYRLRIWRLNNDYWLATVFDESSQTEEEIGRIRTRAGQGDLRSNVVDFVEYYGGEFSSCADLSASRVTFHRPTGNNGRVSFVAAGASIGRGTCGEWRHARQSSNSAEHLLGLDGPYFIQTALPGAYCLDASGGGYLSFTYMRQCNANNSNLRWFRESWGGLSSDVPPYRCLDANTGAFGAYTYMRSCNSANPNLNWFRRQVGLLPSVQIRARTAGERCLDANTGAFGANTYMRDCDGGQNQNLLWNLLRP